MLVLVDDVELLAPTLAFSSADAAAAAAAAAAFTVDVAAGPAAGRLLAKIGDGSMTVTKFDGNTPILFFKRPRHQPSST